MNAHTEQQTSGNQWASAFFLANQASERGFLPEFVRHDRTGITVFGDFITSTAASDSRTAQESSGRGSSSLDHERQKAAYNSAQEALLRELRLRFVMPSEVITFLASRRTLPHLLAEAPRHLSEAFGQDVIVSLELSTDEEGYQTLYAVAIWQADAGHAALALNRFLENWWIHQMNAANSDLAFVYRLV